MTEAGTARAYAARLLADLGIQDVNLPDISEQHPADLWHRSGLQALTGAADQPGRMCPLPLAACADGSLAALQTICCVSLGDLRGSSLLSERAAMMGLRRNGPVAPGGSCHLLNAVDGRLAVNLPRVEDWAMVPAWLEADDAIEEGDWDALAVCIAFRKSLPTVRRARLMGLAVSAEQPVSPSQSWFRQQTIGTAVQRERPPLVLDLSTLWAGPLCTHLLQKLGARVLKLESPLRPDGAREGNEQFFHLLNADKECLSLDLTVDHGREQFLKLLSRADIVVESARPRGLRQLGIHAGELVRQHPGLIWLGISAYGREGEQAGWVGFGDDVAVAAGLSRVMADVTGEPMFCADAIADPLTGIHAALAAMAAYQSGGGCTLSLAMKDVTAYCAGFRLPASLDALRRRHHEWSMRVEAESATMPAARLPSGKAHALGEDTEAIIGHSAELTKQG